MQRISEIIKTAQQDLQQARMFTEPIFRRMNIDYTSFKKLLWIECEKIMVERHQSGYQVDERIEPVFKLLHAYFTDKDFKGDPNKGLMIFGSIGVGKSLLMKGFTRLILNLTGKNIAFVSAFNLNRLIIERGIADFVKRPLLIDDLGKEQELIKDYGTDVRPVLELFAARYDHNSLNFVTTNYNLNTLAKKYGSQIADRFSEMFNFITMEGRSRRINGTAITSKTK